MYTIISRDLHVRHVSIYTTHKNNVRILRAVGGEYDGSVTVLA